MHKIRAYALKSEVCARKSTEVRKHVRGSRVERAWLAVSATFQVGKA